MANRGLSLSHNDSDVEQVYTSQILNESPHPLGSSRITDKYTFLSLDINLSFRKWLGTGRSCLVVADTADTTIVSAVSATTRHDYFVYLPIKDLAPFSIHIPTKNPLLH